MKQRPPIIQSGALGLLAGLVGSLCCLGPSAALLLGLGSSSALAGLAFDRGPALAAGAALLIGGLVLAVRQSRACALAGRGGWDKPALVLVTFALSYGLLGYLLPALAAREANMAAAAAPLAPALLAGAPLRQATLIVEKMSCRPCAANVHGLLSRKPYVQAFIAEEGNEQVTIEYDSQQISASELAVLFPRTYRVTLIGDRALP